MDETPLTDGPAGEDYSLFDGALQLRQTVAGQRTSLDAVLLADFLPVGSPFVELGTGHGACSLAALYLGRAEAALGIELQPEAAELADFNARRLGLKLTVRQGDLRDHDLLPPPGAYGRVIANPPFRALGDGRSSPDESRELSRREVGATLTDFLAAARRLLNPGGTLTLIYTARRLAELLEGLRRYSLEPKRLRLVHPRLGAPARLALVESRRDGGVELRVEPPLFTHEENAHSQELRALLARRPGPAADGLRPAEGERP